MGEVYRARDTRLRRDVAIKVLPESFADDPDRLARFQREAQVLASLNHPNIGGIHGLEESGGARDLVMELVEGKSFERIARGPLPIDEALRSRSKSPRRWKRRTRKGSSPRSQAREIKSPRRWHREGARLRPGENNGGAVVSDRGGASDSPTISGPATLSGAGVLLGTAAYMSPEQARGTSLDRRTDIWSFGCVLYEMLAGRAPFAGDTISETLAAILEREPDRTLLPADTPVPIRGLLRRCLEKDREGRLDSAADAQLEINDAVETLPSKSARLLPTGLHRHERRERSGLVLRRHRGGNSQRSDATQGSEGRRAYIGVLFQGQGRRPSDHR